ncbi:hypothetical protein FIBSPDRAFT_802761 [Athelia psychrophila]|uniref:MYND-type domain-containing protein n=1 Tax=Athelia psychrophila TaxID=1759441 RepID=A0A165XLK9_9AGAM|nr:hypothetical protein FIBSPDRAFT_802761 [Fibularhizoctonia sp. CBS 109695]
MATTGPPRTVYLPLEKLDKCAKCSKKTDLRLCSSCSEQIYCSAQCQKADWGDHKPICGKTDKIDLASFYPFFACLVEASHLQGDKPIPHALSHQIVNNPHPQCPPVEFPDGWAGRPVILGDQLTTPPGGDEWWPSSPSLNVRGKLLRRIMREGSVLPILTAVCISLMAEMYTTTKKRRTRLRYKSSPISDFGIAMGSARVTNQDKLAYFRLSDGTFDHGQDPDKHYWIYFTTIRGEEILLDCAMFSFNMCLMINGTESYLPPLRPMSQFAPAFFRDRVIDANTPDMHTERKRMSILRSETLRQTVANSADGFTPVDVAVFTSFMQRLSNKKCTVKESELAGTYATLHCGFTRLCLQERRWEKWPATPELGIEQDPGESIDDPDDGSDAWFAHLKKWKKMKKAGKADGTMAQVHRAWRDEWEAAKRK